MGQKQSYRLGESATRNVTGDGEVAYNTDTPAPGQPTSVLIRPVDNDKILATALQTLPEETMEGVAPVSTTPADIEPSTQEEPPVLVSVIPATPATNESYEDAEPASENNDESSHSVVVSSNIKTTTKFSNDQGDEETQGFKHVAIVDSPSQKYVTNVQEEYAVDCGEFEKSTILVQETSSPQPMTPPSSLTEDSLDVLQRIEPLPQIPLQSTTTHVQA